MLERLQELRLNVSAGALLCIVTGLLFVTHPGSTTIFLTKAIGVLVLLIGVFIFLGRVLAESIRSGGMIVAALIIAMGLYIFTHPVNAARVIPIILGLVLITNGVEDFSLAFACRRAFGLRWWLGIVFGALNLVFGLVCIANAFGVIKLAMVVAGAMLIWDGVSSLFIVHKVNSAENVVIDSKISREEDI